MFSRFKLHRSPTFQLCDIDPEKIPFLAPNEIIRILSQENRIRSIRRLAGLNSVDYERFYTPALNEFLNLSQLRPASAADHHAGLGGLVTHTLAVIEVAMRRRKAASLPQSADASLIEREEHIWTYAVFVAALLHDAGKIITLTRLVNRAGQLAESETAKSYAIQFLQLPYRLQTRVNTTMFYLLPPAGRTWLQTFPEILAQLVAYLSGDPYEWGAIGDITSQADGESVAKDRRTGGEKQRLPHSPGTPIVERMTRALRKLIYDGDLKFNRDGGAAWVCGQYTYIVCGVAARKVREALMDEGSSDIPGNNTRLFDIWQDHAYIVVNDADKAIWNIKVEAKDYQHTFSMLKFLTREIFHPSRRPADFEGTLEILAQATKAQATETETIPETEKTAIQQESATNLTPTSMNKGAVDTPLIGTEAVSSDTEKKPAKPSKPAPIEDHIPTPVSVDSEEVGKHFIAWMRARLNNGEISINNSKAIVHILPEGVALVSPAAFQYYLKHHTFEVGPDDKKTQHRRLQARVEKLRLNIKTKRDLNIHKIEIKNSEVRLHVFLFPHSVFYTDGAKPEANEVLTLLR